MRTSVIKINQIELEYVETFCFLGVNLDPNISWKFQLGKLSSTIVRIMNIMNNLKFILPQNILSNIYNSCHIQITAFFYGVMQMSGFFKPQKKTVRIIYKECHLSHTDQIFKNPKIKIVINTAFNY